MGGGGYRNELTNSTFKLDFFLIRRNSVSLSIFVIYEFQAYTDVPLIYFGSSNYMYHYFLI